MGGVEQTVYTIYKQYTFRVWSTHGGPAQAHPSNGAGTDSIRGVALPATNGGGASPPGWGGSVRLYSVKRNRVRMGGPLPTSLSR
jgi:hypothetical protein